MQSSAHRIEKLADGITRITETGVAPWLRCNIWHVRGRDRDLVIDTGMGLDPLKATIMAETDRPLHAIITHAHFDHSAGLWEFDHRLGHACEEPVMAAPDWENTVYGGGWEVAELVNPARYPGFDPATYRVRPAPLTGHLDEGDVVDLGDRAFRVLHLPGHSPGSIGLWEIGTRALFSGDAVYDGLLLDNLPHSEPAVLRATLERIRGLGAEVIHGGHYGSFGRERLGEIVDAYLAGGQRITDFPKWMRTQVCPATAWAD